MTRVLLCVSVVLTATVSHAQTTYVWNNTTGNWSDGARWGGTAPSGANNTDILQFGSAGFLTAYTSTNNVANPFVLNRLNLGGNTQIGGSSSGNTIAGSGLRFAGTAPLIDFTSAGNYQITAPVELAANLTIRPNSPSTNYQLTFGSLSSGNQITGTGALVVDGTGTTNRTVTFLYGDGNTYAGGTQVLGGATVHIQSDAALGGGGVTLSTGTLRSNVDGGVDFSTRAFTFSGANTLATDGFWMFTGPLTGGGGVTVQNIFGGGPAVFRFAGNSNTYSGGTTVTANSQLIALNASGSATGSGAVTVQSNGTLGGTGVIAGAVTVQTDGRLSPGDRGTAASSQGNLTLQGGVNLSGGAIYLWNLGALSTSNPGADFDTVTLSGGNLALGGTSKLTLEFNVFGVNPNTANAFWNSVREWTILDVTGAGTNTGNTTFSSITNPSWATGSFSILDPATRGGDIVLRFTPVPEPAVTLTCCVAVLTAGGVIRRRYGRPATP